MPQAYAETTQHEEFSPSLYLHGLLKKETGRPFVVFQEQSLDEINKYGRRSKFIWDVCEIPHERQIEGDSSHVRIVAPTVRIEATVNGTRTGISRDEIDYVVADRRMRLDYRDDIGLYLHEFGILHGTGDEWLRYAIGNANASKLVDNPDAVKKQQHGLFRETYLMRDCLEQLLREAKARGRWH